MKRLSWILLLLCFTAFAVAQGPGPGEQGPPQRQGPGGGPETQGGMMMRHPTMGGEIGMHTDGHDPLAGLMFPPEHILRMADMLNLSDQQKMAIRNEVKTTQPKFLDLQFQLQDQTQAFAKLLHADKTDDKAALAALDQVLDTERQIKRLQVGMLVRVKNLLTAEQIQKLHSMHEMHRHMMQPRRPDGGEEQPKRPQGEE